MGVSHYRLDGASGTSSDVGPEGMPSPLVFYYMNRFQRVKGGTGNRPQVKSVAELSLSLGHPIADEITNAAMALRRLLQSEELARYSKRPFIIQRFTVCFVYLLRPFVLFCVLQLK